jgi:hypothetical protein
MRAKSAGDDMTFQHPKPRLRLRDSQTQLIANAAFFALFPGFFFYHTLLGTGTTGAFLGGYFSPVSILFALPLAAILSAHYKFSSRRISALEIHCLIFLSYFLIIVIFNSIAGANRVIVVNHLLCILFMVNSFIIFSIIDFSSSTFRIIALAALLGMSTIAFSYSINGVFYLGALGVAKDADSLATYQGFARSYLVTVLPLVAFTSSIALRLPLYALAVATLFVNTARSEFVALLFVIPVIEFYFSRRKTLFILAAVLICVWLNSYLDQLLSAVPDNRILELLDLSHSSSANKRHHLSAHAIQTIMAHPFLGDYASYAPGYYAHNILSAWVDLGLFGFIYVIAILISPAAPIFLREYFSSRPDGKVILGLSLMCSTSLLLATSHYFTDMLIGTTLGAYAQYQYGRKYGKHRTPDVGTSASRYPDIHKTMP